jgi:hypothetical protein
MYLCLYGSCVCVCFADEYGSGLPALGQSSLLRNFVVFGTPISRAPTAQPGRAAGMNGSAPLLRWSSRGRSESRGRRFLGSLRRAVQGFMFPVGEKVGRAGQLPNLFLSLR